MKDTMDTTEMTHDERETAERREKWTRGRDNARAASRDWERFGDAVADMLDNLSHFTPVLPDADPGEWYMSSRPDIVSVEDLGNNLAGIVQDAYAMSGVYRRAADKLDTALNQDAAA